MVEIAAAVIEDAAGRILVARRPEGVHLAGLWEFPGGKVRPGESPEEACRRECREEVGAEVEVAGRAAEPIVHRYPERTVSLHFFRCTLAVGSPAPRALGAAEVRWVEPAALNELEWPAANHELVARLTRR